MDALKGALSNKILGSLNYGRVNKNNDFFKNFRRCNFWESSSMANFSPSDVDHQVTGNL